MPHVIIEHSAPVADTHDLQALCQSIFDTLAALPEVPNAASLKIRTLLCPAWVIGTEPQSFAHATLLALPGRSETQKATLTEAILKDLERHLPDVGSLSVNFGELDAAYTKRTL